MKKIVLIGKWSRGKKTTVVDLQAFREHKKKREAKRLDKKSPK